MERKKIAVFISGSGTNLQALIDHSLKVFSILIRIGSALS
jgi:folate-dependent phosphoribosylglycinamide formyltransferase PurN